MPQRVNIRPGVSVLSVLRHLNYKPWFALAEFVDNSVQSFQSNRSELQAFAAPAHLTVSIELGSEADPRITIRDDAFGISRADYNRAFRPAQLPPDRSGLSEFGMGMKSAACWFARTWQVRTAALGEGVERTISFDIASIVADNIEEIDIVERPTSTAYHFTEVILEHLYKPPYGQTRGKIKAHLASIYRMFLRQGWLTIKVDGEELSFDLPAILNAPDERTPAGPPVFWKRDIDFDFGNGLRVKGFAALRERGSTADAGFSLFRRGRLIEGSHDEGYRPEYIFGRSNSYAYQRVFGELEVEGFDVSHTKDGFQWDDNEEVFLELLREELNGEPLPLLTQAITYRALRSRADWQRPATTATTHIVAAIENSAGPVVERLVATSPVETPESGQAPDAVVRRAAHIRFRGDLWTVIIEATTDPAVGDCFSVTDTRRTERQIGVAIALNHPFIRRWVGDSADDLEPVLRIATGLALAEVAASLSGVAMAGTIRRNLNDLLTTALTE